MSYPHTGYDLRNCSGTSGFIFSGNEKMTENPSYLHNQISLVDQMAKKIVELEKRIEFLEKTEIRRNCD